MSRPIRILAAAVLSLFSFSGAGADTTASVSVVATQADTVATFSGFTSPGAFITVTDGVSVVGTVSAAADGTFTKSLISQTPGSHNFGVQAIDAGGLATSLYSVVVSLSPHAETVINNIILATTMEELAGGKPGMHGSTAPGSEITIFVDAGPFTETETAAADGTWSHTFTTPLPPGSYSAYAVVRTPQGLVSGSSATINFVVTCILADYDCSGRVDIVDFSILMYYWGSSDPTADLNGDAMIDLTDFSIMMYYWNG